MKGYAAMKTHTHSLIALLLALLFVLPPSVNAQQVEVITRGQGGVGSLWLGYGTASAEQILVQKTTLTNAQVLALNNSPITVVAASGTGKVIDVIGVLICFDYTAAYTGGANMRLYYGARTTGSAASGSITVSGLLVSVSADHCFRVTGTPENTDLPTSSTAVVLQLQTGPDFGGGNASNAVTVQVIYRVLFQP